MYDLAIIRGDLYIDGQYECKNLYIKDGKIAHISDEVFDSKEIYYAEGKKVFPGFIDPHVHFELGGGSFCSSDDFYSGSVSAAYGGITTIIDFLDPVAKAEDVEPAFNSRKKLAEKSVIDYSFHVTLKNPKNEVAGIVKEMNRLQIPTVKIFTTYSDSGRRTYDNELKELLKLSKENNFMVLAHIENDDMIDLNPDFTVADLPKSRCADAETKEALKLAEFTKNLDGKLYMVHLSSGKTLKMLQEKYSDILNKDFIVESCPHYFTISSDMLSTEKGHLYTMAPPLRNKEAVQLLNERFDYVDTIGTDHCPFMKAEKEKDKLIGMPMGIGGVEHSFNIMYSLFGDKAIDKMTINPAKIHGLYPKKGVLLIGSDADIVIFDPSKEHVIEKDHSACDYSVFEGFTVSGQIESTISKGHFIIKNGEFFGGQGQYLRRG